MQRISVYIHEETKKRISLTAKAKAKDQSEIIREALDKGLKILYPVSTSAKALVNLAIKAQKIPSKENAPKDLSLNLDYYAWGGEKVKS